MRDMRLSFRDRRHLSNIYQLIQTSAREHSIVINPVPALCPSKPAKLTSLASTSSTAEWRVSYELRRLTMAAGVRNGGGEGASGEGEARRDHTMVGMRIVLRGSAIPSAMRDRGERQKQPTRAIQCVYAGASVAGWSSARL